MLTRVAEYRFDTPLGPRVAVTVTPAGNVRVGRARLERYRKQGYIGDEIDRELVAHARARAGHDQLIVFRGRAPDGSGSWDLAGELSEEERQSLGFHLMKDQLATYRRLVAAGVFALVHVDFSQAAVEAYTHGTRQLLKELEAQSVPEVEADSELVTIDLVDRWILEQLTFFFSEPFEQIIERVLSTQMPKLEERVPHLREMVKSLPRHATDWPKSGRSV